MSTIMPAQIENLKTLKMQLAQHGGCELTVYNVDVSSIKITKRLDNTIFIGCQFNSLEQQHQLELLGATIFPSFNNVPYSPFRKTLYTCDELLEGHSKKGYLGTKDFEIFEHFDRARYQPKLLEKLAQRIHDHAIDQALNKIVHAAPNGIVAIMGGHGTLRNDPWYRRVARISFMLTQKNYLIASGGGPGLMEAANLGAFLSNFKDISIIDAAIKILAKAPKFDGGEKEGTQAYLDAISNYVNAAETVRRRTQQKSFAKYKAKRKKPGESLAIPTWFYGHEPTNLFCDNVAKYFSNGIREDTLLAIARSGVIFAPGSAGTLQEVFMDLAQNHYATFVDRSPMVFLSKKHFSSTYGLLRHFVVEHNTDTLYGDLIDIFDDEKDVVNFITTNPPRARKKHLPLYELPTHKK